MVPPDDAVSVAVCAVVTAVTVAVNAALLAPAATITDAGTVTAELLLVRATVCPPGPAGELNVTPQATVPAPVIDPVPQLTPVSTPGATAAPLSAIAIVLPAAFVVSVTLPVFGPNPLASKVNVSVAVCPGFSVRGKLSPVIPNAAAPPTVAALIVSGAVPDEYNSTVCGVAFVFTATSPNDTVLALSVSAGAAPVPCTAIVSGPALVVSVTVPVFSPAVFESKLSVSVAVCPGFSVSGKLNPDIPKAGAPLMVAPLIVTGPVPDEYSVTVFGTAAVFTSTSPNARLVVLSVSAGVAPVPRTAIVDGSAVEFDVKVKVPVFNPDVLGSKLTVRVADCPGFSVRGKLTPEIPNPADPLRVAPLIVTGFVPIELNFTVCGGGAVFSCTTPNDRLLVLTISVGVAPVPCTATVAMAGEAFVDKATVAVFNPGVFGSKLTARVAVCPGFSVIGKVTPDISKAAAPVMDPVLMVNGAVPDDVTVTVRGVAFVFRSTTPNARLLVFSVSAGAIPVPRTATVANPADVFVVSVRVPVFNPVVFESKLSVSVAVCPGFSVSGKLTPDIPKAGAALSVPALMISGAVPDEVRVTFFAGAAVFTSTAPNATLVALSVNPGAPTAVPLSAMTASPAGAFVVIVRFADFAPAVDASKVTVRVAACPGLSVNGKVTPDIPKAPDPAIDAALMTSGAVPDEVRVTVFGVAAVLTVTLPNTTLPALMVRAGVCAACAVPNPGRPIRRQHARIAGKETVHPRCFPIRPQFG